MKPKDIIAESVFKFKGPKTSENIIKWPLRVTYDVLADVMFYPHIHLLRYRHQRRMAHQNLRDVVNLIQVTEKLSA